MPQRVDKPVPSLEAPIGFMVYMFESRDTPLPVGLKYHASQSWTYKESRSRTMLVYRNIEKGPV